LIADFESGATGVLESSKLASGRNESWRSMDYVEINGSERSFVFTTGDWNKLQTGRLGGPGLETIDVPREFWKTPGSPRELGSGDPLSHVPLRSDLGVRGCDSQPSSVQAGLLRWRACAGRH
jgi:hypothetical protein